MKSIDTGAVAARFAYTPFGEVLDRIISNTACDISIGFAGAFGVMREPNGLYFMTARYYDPSIGRFLSEDPLGLGGGDVTLYSYAGNNPVVFVDPSGLCAVSSGEHFRQQQFFQFLKGINLILFIMNNIQRGVSIPFGSKAAPINSYKPDDATFNVPFNNRYLMQYDVSNDGEYKGRVIQSKRAVFDMFKKNYIPLIHIYNK